MPDEDTARALYDMTQEICAAPACRPTRFPITRGPAPSAGTISSTGAWQEYAGIGPGAHGRLDIEGERHATATEKRPETWLMRVEAAGHGVITDDMLTREEMADEFLLMGLRLAEGIDPARYAALAGRPLDPRRIAILRDARRSSRRRPTATCGSRRRAFRCSTRWWPIWRRKRYVSGYLLDCQWESPAAVCKLPYHFNRPLSAEDRRPEHRPWRPDSPKSRTIWC